MISKNYLDFLALVDFLLVLDFKEHLEADFEVDFLVQEDLLQHWESCSTAIDQKYSSLPCGQPAFCHK